MPAPAPAGGAQRAAGANVTLQLQGVTRDQFTARQAEYNHIIAQARGRAHLKGFVLISYCGLGLQGGQTDGRDALASSVGHDKAGLLSPFADRILM